MLRSDELLPQKPFSDDGYYTLTISRNIAGGKGLTIDGRTWTNGFQPLYAFVVAPAFLAAGKDRVLALRYVAGINWLLLVVTSLMVGRLVEQFYHGSGAVGIWLGGAAIWQSALGISLLYYNGLETGLMITMYVAIWLYMTKMQRDKVASLSILGVLFGLLILTRIDNAIVVVLLVAVALYRFVRDKNTHNLLRMLFVATVALVVSSPWWIYNYLGFGSLMPISGQAQSGFGFDPGRVVSAIYAIAENINPWVFLAKKEGVVVSLAIVVVSVGVVALGWRMMVKKERCSTLNAMQRDFLLAVMLHIVVIVAYYTLYTWATHHYERYFAPIALLSSVLALIVARALMTPRRKVYTAIAATMVAAHVVVYGAFQQGLLFHESPFWSQYVLVKKHVPDRESVGAWQSGTLGYFRDFVINLDGKVNPEALRTNTLSYLKEKQITWLCDDERGLLPRLRTDMKDWNIVDTRRGFVLLTRQ